jgi:hypothetical protein
MTADAPIRRWDAFIVNSHLRFQALLDEAAAGSEPLIASIRSDLTPLVLPWNAMSPRLREACDEVSAYWDHISNELSECSDVSHEMMMHEGAKRDLATLELELLYERVYGAVMARAAARKLEHALAVDASLLACNHCGAALDKVSPVSQSLNVACAYCRSINTVHPSAALRMFAAAGSMHLAAEEARAAGEQMRRLDCRIKQYRDAKQVPLRLLVELESATRTYWSTRLGVEVRYDPDQARYLAAKLDRYMKDVQRTLRRYWQWREHEDAIAARPM